MAQDIVLKVAAKAVILNDKGQVLVVREGRDYDEGSQLNKYGIPGGRLESGESFKDGLHREVKEETGLEIMPIQPIYVGEWRPVIKDVPHQIVAIFMLCRATTTDVKLSEEHDDFKWIDPAKPGDIVFMDPDDKIMVKVVEWQSKN